MYSVYPSVRDDLDDRDDRYSQTIGRTPFPSPIFGFFLYSILSPTHPFANSASGIYRIKWVSQISGGPNAKREREKEKKKEREETKDSRLKFVCRKGVFILFF